MNANLVSWTVYTETLKNRKVQEYMLFSIVNFSHFLKDKPQATFYVNTLYSSAIDK